MPLVPAKCTKCGANLHVDPSQEAAICEYCATPFITEKAINNFYTTNVTNIESLNVNTVNISQGNSVDILNKAGETFLRLNDFAAARLKFEEMCEKFPYDERGWFGRLKSMTENFQVAVITIESYANMVNLFEKYCVTSEGKDVELSDLKNCRNFLLCVEKMVYEQKISPIESGIREAEAFIDSLNKEIEPLRKKQKPKQLMKHKTDLSVIKDLYRKTQLKYPPNESEWDTTLYYIARIEESIRCTKKEDLDPMIAALKASNEKLERLTAKYITK